MIPIQMHNVASGPRRVYVRECAQTRALVRQPKNHAIAYTILPRRTVAQCPFNSEHVKNVTKWTRKGTRSELQIDNQHVLYMSKRLLYY